MSDYAAYEPMAPWDVWADGHRLRPVCVISFAESGERVFEKRPPSQQPPSTANTLSFMYMFVGWLLLTLILFVLCLIQVVLPRLVFRALSSLRPQAKNALVAASLSFRFRAQRPSNVSRHRGQSKPNPAAFVTLQHQSTCRRCVLSSGTRTTWHAPASMYANKLSSIA